MHALATGQHKHFCSSHLAFQYGALWPEALLGFPMIDLLHAMVRFLSHKSAYVNRRRQAVVASLHQVWSWQPQRKNMMRTKLQSIEAMLQPHRQTHMEHTRTNSRYFAWIFSFHVLLVLTCTSQLFIVLLHCNYLTALGDSYCSKTNILVCVKVKNTLCEVFLVIKLANSVYKHSWNTQSKNQLEN